MPQTEIPQVGLRWHVATPGGYPYHLTSEGSMEALCGLTTRARAQWSPRRGSPSSGGPFRTYWEWTSYCRPCSDRAQAILRGETETALSDLSSEGEAVRSSDRQSPSYFLGEELPTGAWIARDTLSDAYQVGFSDGSQYLVSTRVAAEFGYRLAECIRQAQSVPAYALRGRTRSALFHEYLIAASRTQRNNRVGYDNSVSDSSGISGTGYRPLDNPLWIDELIRSWNHTTAG